MQVRLCQPDDSDVVQDFRPDQPCRLCCQFMPLVPSAKGEFCDNFEPLPRSLAGAGTGIHPAPSTPGICRQLWWSEEPRWAVP